MREREREREREGGIERGGEGERDRAGGGLKLLDETHRIRVCTLLSSDLLRTTIGLPYRTSDFLLTISCLSTIFRLPPDYLLVSKVF